MTLIFEVERDDAIVKIVSNPVPSGLIFISPMVLISCKVHARSMLIFSEKHVLRVIIDQVLLLRCQIELTDESSDTELLDNLKDVKLRVKLLARLTLQLVNIIVRGAAAQAPGTGEVFLAEEAPSCVAEWTTAVTSLSKQVIPELSLGGRNSRIMRTLLG